MILENIIKSSHYIFILLFHYYLHLEMSGPFIRRMFNRCFVPGFVEIAPVVFEKIPNVVNGSFLHFFILSPLGKKQDSTFVLYRKNAFCQV